MYIYHVPGILFWEWIPIGIIITNLYSRQLEVKVTRSFSQENSHDLTQGFSDSKVLVLLPLSKGKKTGQLMSTWLHGP